MSDIVLYVNGKKYEGWKSADVTRSIEAVSGSFRLITNDKWDINKDPWKIFPGDKCRIEIGGVTLITGWVDSVAPSYSTTDHGIEISGRDVTCDLVDCSAVVKSFEIRGQTIGGLTKMLCAPFGIPVLDTAGDTEVFPVVAIQPGETVFACIEREARQRDIILTTNGTGSLVLGMVGSLKAADKLIQGGNIITASANFDFSNRFSEYIVKGQQPAQGESEDSWNPPQNDVESRYTDGNITRYRPLILTGESQMYEKSAETRAKREAAQRTGESTQVSVTVQGWTQSNGELWPLNGTVKIESPALYLSHELIIDSVNFTAGDGGSNTVMVLKQPDAFLNLDSAGKAAKKANKKKGSSVEDYSKYWEDAKEAGE
ncbi:MAG: hypothetical protein VB076_05125 [Synergistaceae bacterium]|nr:hypothetical protein [Synergistaceae bacterium]